MRELFHFTVPHVPVAKGRARATVRANGRAGTYTPAKTRKFEDFVRLTAAQAYGAGRDPLTCPVDLVVEFLFAIPPSWPKWKRDLAAQGLVHHTSKPDCSNLVKAVEDACNGVLFKDDGQVVGVIVDKAYTTGAERVIVSGFEREGLTSQDKRAQVVELTRPRSPMDVLAMRNAARPLGARFMGAMRHVTPGL